MDSDNTVSAQQFADFVHYMRRMLGDIAAARTGLYSQSLGIEEITVVWNLSPDNPLEGHPRPENITHVKTEPYSCPVELGKYAFKAAMHEIMAGQGYKKAEDFTFVSEMGQGEYSMNLGSGGDAQGADQIHYIFIRSRSNIGQIIDKFTDLSDGQLAAHCRRALEGLRLTVEDPRPLAVPGCAP